MATQAQLIDKVTSQVLAAWPAVPPRIDLPDGDAVFGAGVGWDNGAFQLVQGAVSDLPPPVPEMISDRQFFQQLASQNVITQEEALAAVTVGTLPATLAQFIATLPADQQFAAKMILCGATQFLRHHPMVAMFGAALGWTETQIDDLWRAAAIL